MDGLDGYLDKLTGFLDDSKAVAKTPIGSAIAGAAIGGAVVGGTILAVQGIKKAGSSRSKARTKKGRSRDRKYISRQKHEVAYQKRRKRLGKKTTGKRYKTKTHSKSKSKKGIHYTKNGQPYKIMANGRARFIKKTRR